MLRRHSVPELPKDGSQPFQPRPRTSRRDSVPSSSSSSSSAQSCRSNFKEVAVSNKDIFSNVGAAEVDDEDVDSEVECPLCLDVLHDAVATPCEHIFCRACIGRALTSGHAACPLCRASLKSFDIGTRPDAAAARRVSKLVPTSELLRRAREQPAQLVVVVGNDYSRVEPSEGRPLNVHRWTMCVSLSFRGEAIDTMQLANVIEKVTYKLHASFKANVVNAKAPTFTHTSTGWGCFDVGCTIHWKKRLGLQPTDITHGLVFGVAGGRTATILTIEDRRLAVLFKHLLNRR